MKFLKIEVVGVTAIFLLILLLSPPTREVVRRQWDQITHPVGILWLCQYLGVDPSLYDSSRIDRQLEAIAKHHPNDLQIQLGYALLRSEQDPGLRSGAKRLRALLSRFAENPTFCATLMRYMTLGEVMVRRKEAAWPTSGGSVSTHYPPSASASLKLFDRLAATGERLDPENAYFPFMRAVGLFAAHRDQEALEAIRRASTRPRWEEYIEDEVKGIWRLTEEAFGEQGVGVKWITLSTVLFPHYAQLRQAARVATYKAALLEQASQKEKGIAIRRSLMRCGSLMRVQSRWIIGSLVGIALTSLATTHPSGKPSSLSPGFPPAQQEAQRIGAYTRYLEQIGHPEEARWVQAEWKAGIQVKQLMTQATACGVGFDDQPITSMLRVWILDLLVFSNAFWTVIIGLTAFLLARARLQDGAVPTLVLGVVILSMGVGAWVCGNSIGKIIRIYSSVQNLFSGSSASSFFSLPSWFPLSSWLVLDATLTLGAVLVPAFLLVALLLSGLGEDTPLARRVVEGLDKSALLIGCVLLLLYASLASATARSERLLTQKLERILQHEGRYYAEQLGKTWPP